MTLANRAYATPLKHDRVRPLHRRLAVQPRRQVRRKDARPPVTVCIAASLNWQYPNGDIGRAVLTASDRMMTAGDIQYEPYQTKVCFLRRSVLLLVAGDMVIHSQAVRRMQRKLLSEPSDNVEAIACEYGQFISDIRRKQASTMYLSPLGLDEQSFLQQNNMNQQLIFELASQLQDYSLDVEALVVGCDGLNAHIFHVRDDGIVSCLDDINFAAIGMGRDHAKSQFMFIQYPKLITYYYALPILYVAKKRAEVAPGVGRETDYHLVTRDACVLIEPELIEVCKRHYEDAQSLVTGKYREAARDLENEHHQLHAKLFKQPEQQPTGNGSEDRLADQAAKAASSSKDQT